MPTVIWVVVFLVAGFLACWFGSMIKSGDKDKPTGCLTLFLFPVLTEAGILMAYDYGTGKPYVYFLDNNAIYETLNSVSVGKIYAAILRKQDGSKTLYLLDQNPPKMFKYIRQPNGVQMYEPFPPVSPAPSVPPKK